MYSNLLIILQFKIYLIFLIFFLILQYCIGFAIHWHGSAMDVYVFPILNSPPTSLPFPSHCVIQASRKLLQNEIAVSFPGSHILLKEKPGNKRANS